MLDGERHQLRLLRLARRAPAGEEVEDDPAARHAGSVANTPPCNVAARTMAGRGLAHERAVDGHGGGGRRIASAATSAATTMTTAPTTQRVVCRRWNGADARPGRSSRPGSTRSRQATRRGAARCPSRWRPHRIGPAGRARSGRPGRPRRRPRRQRPLPAARTPPRPPATGRPAHGRRHRVGGPAPALPGTAARADPIRRASRPPTATDEGLDRDADRHRSARDGRSRPRSGRRRRLRLESMAGVPTASVFGPYCSTAGRTPVAVDPDDGLGGARAGVRIWVRPRKRCGGRRRRHPAGAASPRHGGRRMSPRPGPRRSPPRRGAPPCRRWRAPPARATRPLRCGGRPGREHELAHVGGSREPSQPEGGEGAEAPHPAGHAHHHERHTAGQAGTVNRSRNVPRVVLRQAAPARSPSGRAGPGRWATVMALKYGAPTVTCWPRNAS